MLRNWLFIEIKRIRYPAMSPKDPSFGCNDTGAMRITWQSLAFCMLFAACGRAANYTTYTGDQFSYELTSIAADAAGNTYVAGNRAIVVPTLAQEVDSGNYKVSTDILVGKLGRIRRADTYSPCSAAKAATARMALRSTAAGTSMWWEPQAPRDFPVRHPLQNGCHTGGTGFLLKMKPDGTLVYSTWLGGTVAASALSAVAVDKTGTRMLRAPRPLPITRRQPPSPRFLFRPFGLLVR